MRIDSAPVRIRNLTFALALTSTACVRSVADVPTEEGGFITGTVVARSARTGLFEAVGGARVDIVGGSVGRTTDAMGMFTLSRLPLDTHRLDIAIRAAGGLPPRALRQSVRLEADGQSVDLGPIRLGDNAELLGTVRLADAEAEDAAQGTLVVLVDTPFVAIVGADGTYAFQAVPPGSYRLVAFRPGYARGGYEDVLLQPSVKAELSEIVLGAVEDVPDRIEVKGRVDVIGADDGGVMVAFIDETTTATPNRYETTTIADGSFTAGVPEGLYRVRFTRTDIRPSERRNVLVTAEGAVGLDPVYLGLATPGDADGDGVADATDADDDDDGCLDNLDQYATNPLFCFDADMDGIPDEEDVDNDNDTLFDVEETSAGADGWVTSPFDADTDDDDIPDGEDNCPLLASEEPLDDLNGNGIGDLCEEGTTTSTTTPVGTPPTVTQMMPTTAPIGALVTIDGTNFVANLAQTFVSFAGGLTPVDQVTPTRIAVRVPAEAQSGVVRVYTGPFVVTATSSFVLVPPPVVRSFSPASARPGQLVAVFGDRFDAPDSVVLVAGQATDPVTCPAPVMTSAAAMGLDVLCFRPAPGTVSGRVTVSSSYGAGTSFAALTVLEGPQIVRFSINPVSPGAQTSIIGAGFGLDGLSGAVTVDLAGASGIVPTLVTETSITIDVPMNASTGAVTVRHPAGDVTSMAILQVTNGAPGIVDFSPNPVMVGEELVITGFDLAQATEIEFANGVRAVPTSAQPTEVRVTVPAGVAPGPLTAIAPTANGTSSTRLALMTMIQNAPYPGQVFIPGFAPATGDVGVVIGVDGLARQIDTTTLTPIGQPGATSLINALRLFGTARGDRGVVFFGSSVLVVDLPSAQGLLSCPWAGPTPQGIVQDVTGRFVFFSETPGAPAGSDGVMRIDLDALTCDFIGLRSDLATGAVGLVGNELLVRDAGNPGAFALMNIDPFDLVPDGTYTADFGTLSTIASFSRLYVQYLGSPTIVFGGGGAVTIETIAGTSPARVIAGSGTIPLAHSTNTRWVISNTQHLVDLAAQRTARTVPTVRVQAAEALRAPAAFIYGLSGSGDVFVRLDIQE